MRLLNVRRTNFEELIKSPETWFMSGSRVFISSRSNENRFIVVTQSAAVLFLGSSISFWACPIRKKLLAWLSNQRKGRSRDLPITRPQSSMKGSLVPSSLFYTAPMFHSTSLHQYAACESWTSNGWRTGSSRPSRSSLREINLGQNVQLNVMILMQFLKPFSNESAIFVLASVVTI